ncbi:MAG: STELLO glycosyltransferase family protein [Acidobacteriia bacterium]|nr:STELLO glycosyltransferase family protein [Terriglobia bacterium]
MSLASVITTIQPPTAAVRQTAARLKQVGASLFIIGDEKSPAAFAVDGAMFVSLADQLGLPLDLARELPTNHYSRKNLGYLLAISEGASAIYETDDDNLPLPGWKVRQETTPAVTANGTGWVNVYKQFTDEHIWPRGFPLDEAGRSHRIDANGEKEVRASIQQELADGSPDVDAVWNLILGREFHFRQGASVFLQKGAWCTFNSQCTWWWPAAYPLLYLPSHCSFRMTDIWRSLVAQRCLWEFNTGVAFHAPEVRQDRNAHDLMKDFEQEIPGYKLNKKIVSILESTTLKQGEAAAEENLLHCYEALVAEGIYPKAELLLVKTWFCDLDRAKLASRKPSSLQA